jgi:release factor glutamine methyltransferase
LSSDPASTTAQTLRAWAIAYLESKHVKFYRKEIDWLLMDACRRSVLDFISEPDHPVSLSDATKFREYIFRRAAREPVQYILGETEFYGLTFSVSPAVLIPRPETEGLIEHALEYLRGMSNAHVLDIGTGSGCIAVALAKHVAGARITGVDVSQDALRLAQINGRFHGVEISWLLADLNSDTFSTQIDGPFDLIISNPPYIAAKDVDLLEPEVREHEPRIALTPGDDPVEVYRTIGQIGRETLRPGGFLMLEINQDLGPKIRFVLQKSGFIDVEIRQDLAGRDRYILARHSPSL